MSSEQKNLSKPSSLEKLRESNEDKRIKEENILKEELKLKGWKLLSRYKNKSTKVEVECDQEHESNIYPKAIAFIDCKICEESKRLEMNDYRNSQKYKTTSKGAQLVHDILENSGIGYTAESKIGYLNQRLSYDFFLFEHDIYLEVDGERHFRYDNAKSIETRENYRHERYLDLVKSIAVIQHGYRLIRIDYKFIKQCYKNVEKFINSCINSQEKCLVSNLNMYKWLETMKVPDEYISKYFSLYYFIEEDKKYSSNPEIYPNLPDPRDVKLKISYPVSKLKSKTVSPPTQNSA